ncbi:MAG: hypothetical protein NT105_13995 [Verrucomicrobia bacterium]|nr:hypothetical protein [Verrucomicrobiota bacterium]
MKTSPLTIKHVPFESIYRQEYEVVEEHRGNLRLYPHTDQLPVISRAINLEFYGALPDKVAHADHRADGYHKLLLYQAVLMFCGIFNRSRPDGLQLYQLLTPELVSKVAVVQRITENTRHGLRHGFRFFTGTDFLPDIHLSGKRILFADHLLQRFSQRVPNHVGEDLHEFLLSFYGTAPVVLQVGRGHGLVVPYDDSILAFPFEETDAEYVFTTCLTINEIHDMDVVLPAGRTLHHGKTFQEPPVRNWAPIESAFKYYKLWRYKKPLGKLPARPARNWDWHKMNYHLKGACERQGFTEGSRLLFLDNIYGPCVLMLRPGQHEFTYNERNHFKQMYPNINWDENYAPALPAPKPAAPPPPPIS